MIAIPNWIKWAVILLLTIIMLAISWQKSDDRDDYKQWKKEKGYGC